MNGVGYPLRVEGRLDPQLSRWLWLVKWILAIPHYIVLTFLWIAFAVMSVVAFFSILFTARYPRAIFDFNVGVLRWSWRVAYYTYGALGTDRYPPFTLAEVPDYPTHLEVAYPEHLSRGLVLVKWWLLAIPHYLVIGLFVGGASYAGWKSDEWQVRGSSLGLIVILVLVAAVVLAFTGRYPRGIFDLVLGLNRWVLRVAAYSGLMTDQYPPFRLDLGGEEPGVLELQEEPPPGGGATGTTQPGATAPSQGAQQPTAPPPTRPWTAGRVVALVLGAVLALMSAGLLLGGLGLLLVDRTQRDSAGFLGPDAERLESSGYALVGDDVDVATDGTNWPDDLLGDVRVRATSRSGEDVFVGLARASDARPYLAGMSYDRVSGFNDGNAEYRPHRGGAPSSQPGEQGFWEASSSGPGTQTITWVLQEGTWVVVVMNADGSSAVDVDADVAAELPVLTWVAVALIVTGVVAAALAALIIYLAVRERTG